MPHIVIETMQRLASEVASVPPVVSTVSIPSENTPPQSQEEAKAHHSHTPVLQSFYLHSLMQPAPASVPEELERKII